MKNRSVEKKAAPRSKGGKRAAVKGLFLDERNALRRWARLLVALAAILAAAWGVPQGMTWLFGRLFTAWGVTADTVARAPGWTQALYGGWVYVNGFLQGAAIALAAVLSGRALGVPVKIGKGLVSGLLLGLAAALAMPGLFLLLDVMRFGRALTSPVLTALTPMLMMYVLLQALGAALATDLVGGILSGWHRRWALAGCAAFYALLFGRWTPIALINGALFGVFLWLAREKKGGIAPALGFLAIFSFLTVTVLGVPPWQQGALYEFYPVSKPWLTGGDAGPWAGLFMTAVLVLLTLARALPNRKTTADAPLRPAIPRPAGKS